MRVNILKAHKSETRMMRHKRKPVDRLQVNYDGSLVLLGFLQ
jgi:hypothetical protein